jgi:tetratricopeptide (TPR) repeat protein
VSDPQDAASEYADLLLRQNELDPRGDTESAELTAICEAMDAPWSRMTGFYRRLMHGLSEDLYALADGRQGIQMSDEERRAWGVAGKAAQRDGAPELQLEHLRKPYPRDIPSAIVAFLQARCWVRLGFPRVALAFYQESGKVLPAGKTAAMDLLRQLGRYKDASDLARGILADPDSRHADIYHACTTLFLSAESLAAGGNPQDVYRSLVTPLRLLLDSEGKTVRSSREDPDLEAAVAHTLVFTLAEIGDYDEMLRVCDAVLARYPKDSALYLARGIANQMTRNPDKAESDFVQAVTFGARSPLPYAALSWYRITEARYDEALGLVSQALSFPGLHSQTQATLYEIRGIALAELNQPLFRIEEEFAKALDLGPANADRIRHNLEVALRHLKTAPDPERHPNWELPVMDRILDQLPTGLAGTLREETVMSVPTESFSQLVGVG